MRPLMRGMGILPVHRSQELLRMAGVDMRRMGKMPMPQMNRPHGELQYENDIPLGRNTRTG
jgi:hypothetical protein